MKHTADRTVHWATGPVNVCEKHANQLVNLGGMLGFHIAVTKLESESECANCVNEASTSENEES